MVKDIGFSLLISTFHRDDPAALDVALESVFQNTLLPSEVVIVLDGPIPSKNYDIITKWKHNLNLKLVQLEKHVGLGAALAIGLERCEFSWVARFDTDDICVPTRFSSQVEFIKCNPEVDLFGGQIREFSPDHATSLRRVPTTHEEIVSFSKLRNPFNHMTVFFRREKALSAGSYWGEIGFEDYSLWMRMIKTGSRTANLGHVLVAARADHKFQDRRGGLQYAMREAEFTLKLWRLGILDTAEAAAALSLKFPARLVSPRARRWIYSRWAREEC